MIRKSQATFELWGKVSGAADTREKWEAKHMQLGADERKRMAGYAVPGCAGGWHTWTC